MFKAKYPMSTNKKQCIGPCYPPGVEFMHPTTLKAIYDASNHVCPVTPWKDKFVDKVVDYATCSKLEKKQDYDINELQVNLIIPTFTFDHAHFLKIGYNIHSFEHAILWYGENPNVPYHTIKRIIDSSWKAYGGEVTEITQTILNFYKYMIIVFWLDKYIKKVNFVLKDTDLEKTKEYIMKNIITDDFIKKYLQKYIARNKDKFDKTKSNMNKIRNYFMCHFKKKVTKNKKDTTEEETE